MDVVSYLRFRYSRFPAVALRCTTLLCIKEVLDKPRETMPKPTDPPESELNAMLACETIFQNPDVERYPYILDFL